MYFYVATVVQITSGLTLVQQEIDSQLLNPNEDYFQNLCTTFLGSAIAVEVLSYPVNNGVMRLAT